jgi:hypothetical protein
MKQIITIISILISVHSFGQKWHLNEINKSKEFCYEYWFQFENLDDTCSYQLNKKSGNHTSIFELFNNQGDTVILANIRIQDIEKDSLTNLVSDFNGTTNTKLEKGKYRIEVSAMNYDKFELAFEINEEQYIELKIKLGLAPELTVYQIDSKIKLTEYEILEIIKCVKKNQPDFYESCSEKSKYLIMKQI